MFRMRLCALGIRSQNKTGMFGHVDEMSGLVDEMSGLVVGKHNTSLIMANSNEVNPRSFPDSSSRIAFEKQKSTPSFSTTTRCSSCGERKKSSEQNDEYFEKEVIRMKLEVASFRSARDHAEQASKIAQKELAEIKTRMSLMEGNKAENEASDVSRQALFVKQRSSPSFSSSLRNRCDKCDPNCGDQYIEQELIRLKLEVASCRSARDHAEQAAKTSREELAKLELRCNNLERERDSSKKQSKYFATVVRRLQTNARESSLERAQLRVRAEALQEERDRCKKRFQSEKNEKENMKKKCEQLEETIRKLASNADKVLQENDELKKSKLNPEEENEKQVSRRVSRSRSVSWLRSSIGKFDEAFARENENSINGFSMALTEESDQSIFDQILNDSPPDEGDTEEPNQNKNMKRFDWFGLKKNNDDSRHSDSKKEMENASIQNLSEDTAYIERISGDSKTSKITTTDKLDQIDGSGLGRNEKREHSQDDSFDIGQNFNWFGLRRLSKSNAVSLKSANSFELGDHEDKGLSDHSNDDDDDDASLELNIFPNATNTRFQNDFEILETSRRTVFGGRMFVDSSNTSPSGETLDLKNEVRIGGCLNESTANQLKKLGKMLQPTLKNSSPPNPVSTFSPAC